VGEVIWEFKENGSISIGGKLGKYSLGDGNRIKILHRDIRLDQPIAPSVFFFAPENETVVPPPPAKPGSSPKPNRSSATEKAR
jgi:hypothetical protein